MGYEDGYVIPGVAGADTEVTGAETQVDTTGIPESLKSYGAVVNVGTVIDVTAAAPTATESASEP